MSKRKPTSDLNDRNWDEEEEPEEAGTFRLADQDVLKNRTIRKAKRSVHTVGSGSGSQGNTFAGFALKTSDSWVPKPVLSTGITGAFGKNFALESKSNGTPQVAPDSVNNGNSSENPEYLRQLKILNENILSWIQKHVSDNPYCILTPSFSDYEKHLSNLEKKYNVGSSTVPEMKPKIDGSDAATSKSSTTPTSQFAASSSMPGGLGGFTFGQTSAVKNTDATKEENTGSKAKGSGLTGTTGFSFGTGLAAGGFGGSNPSQGTGGLFSFAAAQSKVDTSAAPQAPQASGDDEEYVPPQVEVREIKEDGAIYTTRCKLFHQKGGQWADRGVGNLHLKPTGDGRTQLIIRADTNLGNILLNILLSASVPTKRQGKNNVFLVCVPNPPIDANNPSSDPTPMLIRVKTADDADQLLAQLEEHKSSA